MQYPSRKAFPPPALVDNVFHSSDVHLAGILKTQKSQKYFQRLFTKFKKLKKFQKSRKNLKNKRLLKIQKCPDLFKTFEILKLTISADGKRTDR